MAESAFELSVRPDRRWLFEPPRISAVTKNRPLKMRSRIIDIATGSHRFAAEEARDHSCPRGECDSTIFSDAHISNFPAQPWAYSTEADSDPLPTPLANRVVCTTCSG